MQPASRAPTAAVAAPRTARKRVLIVNVFFDEYRRTTGSPYRVPQAMAPCFLAGAFSARACDLRIYNEQYRGCFATRTSSPGPTCWCSPA